MSLSLPATPSYRDQLLRNVELRHLLNATLLTKNSLVPNKWIVGKLSGASGIFTLVYSTQLTTSTSTTSLMYVHSAAKSWHHSDTLSCGHCHSDDWLYAVASLSLERLRW